MPRNSRNRRSRTGYREIWKYGVSAFILCLGAIGCYGLSTLAEPPEDTDPTSLIPLVRTSAAQPFVGELDMEVSGNVVPFREIKVAAQVSGKILKKYPECDAGNYVTKGTKLIEIDPEEYQLELENVKAEIEQAAERIAETEEEIKGAIKNVALAQNDYTLQLRDYERSKRLKGVISNKEVDQAKSALNTAQSQLTSRKNTLESLKARKRSNEASLKVSNARMGKAELNLRRTTIVAPDDGVIVREMAEQGDHVTMGMQMVTFEDTSRSEVLCNLKASELAWLRNYSATDETKLSAKEMKSVNDVYQIPRTNVLVYDSSDPDVVWEGVLERFDGIGRDERTKTIPCRIAILNPIVDTPNGPRALVRGMFVKCKMKIQTSAGGGNQLISFPSDALQPGNYVWTVADEKLVRKNVRLVDRVETDAEELIVVKKVEGSIVDGEAVVVSPLSQPVEGTTVTVEGRKEKVLPDDAEKTAENSSSETTDS